MQVKKTLVIKSTSCGECGIVFGLESAFMAARLDDGRSFYCPNGHFVGWKATNAAQATERALQQARSRELALQDQLSAAIRETESANAELLRIRSRIAVGVCPCCNRSFDNVRGHISTQHPELVVEADKARKQAAYRCSCGSRFETWRGLRVHQGSQRRDGWASPSTSRYAAHLTKVGAR